MPTRGLVAVLVVYAIGVFRLWRTAGFGCGISRLQVLSFTGGWMTLVLALSNRMEAWSVRSVSGHSAQHELFIIVAAPLVSASRPLIACLWLLPRAARRRLLQTILSRPVARTWSALTAPLTVTALLAAALWIWHLPALYDLALEREDVRLVQYACFFGIASLFWWGMAHGRYQPLAHGAAEGYLFAAALQSATLGTLMSLSPQVWYALSLAPGGKGPTLEDQHLAGMLLWLPAAVILTARAISFLALRRRDSHRPRFNTATHSRESGLL